MQMQMIGRINPRARTPNVKFYFWVLKMLSGMYWVSNQAVSIIHYWVLAQYPESWWQISHWAQLFLVQMLGGCPGPGQAGEESVQTGWAEPGSGPCHYGTWRAAG